VAIGLPVDVRALYDAGKRLKEDRERPVRLVVLVEVDAPDALVEAARERLRPKTATGIVDVSVIEPGSVLRVDPKADAAIVLVGSGAHAGPTLTDLRNRAIPTAVLAVREDRASFARLIGHPENDVLVGEDVDELICGLLADWIMRRLEKLHTALGHNFEFVRRAVAKETVRRCAWQNAAIGVAVFLPGADMPLMTLNEGRMLLQIAAAYGQPLDGQRVKELVTVVAGGFVCREVASELLGVIPGLGWAIKGGVAYSGTVAMGSAAIAYFEQGADLIGVARSLTGRAAAVMACSERRRSARRLPEHDGTAAPSRRRRRGYVAVAAQGEGTKDAGTMLAQPLAGEAASVAPGQTTLLDLPPAEPTLLPLDRPDASGDAAGPGL
jgi:uncharacterized protein (DUF697 family)